MLYRICQPLFAKSKRWQDPEFHLDLILLIPNPKTLAFGHFPRVNIQMKD